MAATRYENESSGSSAERVQEAGEPAFPVFDSLPANDGLSTAEAFRLSLKHALALLPRMLAEREQAGSEDSPERFSLR